ncbi:hypothetical protein MC7420_508 [Coleofasciculus chthonoplastes PCC 7420]|uniref:Uncharacterized protein n=1 Tax=Coleofasciculus chthonoplastes PCC 7420 TaxID=118168 RepID=B4VLK9_9CYAN|nr:hypothetical protein MC7420_508 [Coleofasciculus chthonoplastes PCC 7420]
MWNQAIASRIIPNRPNHLPVETRHGASLHGGVRFSLYLYD